MSGTEVDDPGPDVTAAEYVLGTLDEAERAAASARLEVDRTFAAEVRLWEDRLFPLTTLVPAEPPPATLLSRIEQSIGGMASAPANDNRVGFWRATAFGAMAVAAGLALFVAFRPVRPPVFAVLAPTGAVAPVLVAFGGQGGEIGLRPSAAITVAPDRDLQLWSLPSGATRPASLGVLPAGGKQLPPGVEPGTKLLVSLEPKGGSPTGQPTGPVVYGGLLQNFK